MGDPLQSPCRFFQIPCDQLMPIFSSPTNTLHSMFPDCGPRNSDHNLSRNSCPLNNPLRFSLLENLWEEKGREIKTNRNRKKKITKISRNPKRQLFCFHQKAQEVTWNFPKPLLSLKHPSTLFKILHQALLSISPSIRKVCYFIPFHILPHFSSGP